MRDNKLKAAMGQIERAFGKSSIAQQEPVKALSTGSVALNAATEIGGWPRGGIVEVFGPSDTGKTTLMLMTVIEAQKKGLACAWIDTDKKFSSSYAEYVGIDLSEIAILDPDSGEDALDMVTLLLKNDIDLIILDSLAALVPRSDLEAAMGDEIAGVQARMMSSALMKLTNLVHEKEAIIAFTNQIRYRPPQFEGDTAKMVTPGGGALASYAKVRVELRAENEDSKSLEDNRTLFRIVTSSVGRKNSGTIVFNYEKGINRIEDFIELSLSSGALVYEKDQFLLDGKKVCKDRSELVEILSDKDDDTKMSIIKKLRNRNVAYRPLI